MKSTEVSTARGGGGAFAGSAVVVEDAQWKPRQRAPDSTADTASSSSSSDDDNDNAADVAGGKPRRHPWTTTAAAGPAAVVSATGGRVSPSTLFSMTRKLSSAVVTSENADHEFLEGRPKIVCPEAPPQPSERSAAANPLQPRKQQQKHERERTAGSIPRLPAVRRSSTVPLDRRMANFVSQPPPLRVGMWSEPPADRFSVRGRSYLNDGLKVPSEPAPFKLLAVDLVKTEEPLLGGICAHPDERVQMALRREARTGTKELPQFLFVVNYCIPCDPYFHWVAYFGVDDVSILRDRNTPLGRLADPFFFGKSDEFRTRTFKLIPRVVAGNFVIRKAVGSKPSILGRKLKQYYVQHERYFELIVDIGSDGVADKIVKLSLGYAKSLTVDMMFLLEGNSEETLPEQILCGVRSHHPDFKQGNLQRPCRVPAHIE